MVETRARHHKASRVRGQKMCCNDYTCAHISPQWSFLSHLVLNTRSNGQLKFVEVRGTKRMRSRQCSIRERVLGREYAWGEIKSSLSKQHKNKNPHVKTMCIYIYVVLSIFDLRLIVHCIPQFLMSTSEVKRKQEVVIRRATPEDIARQILSYVS